MNNYVIEILPNLIEGLNNTLLVFILTISISLPLGIIISLGRLTQIRLFSRFFQLYVYVMRGTPLLLQIVVIYYGLPYIGIVFDRLTAVLFAFVINYAAYFGEIFRGGIQSIDKGQYEASRVIGLSKVQTFIHIILPQVIKRVLSSVNNEVITLVKDTALIYVVGIGELLRASKIAANRDATLIPFLLAGIIYLIITSILTIFLEAIERRYQYYE